MYIKIMNAPYVNEYSFPFFFLDEKNETVKGIIGNTQGVNKARNPPIKPKRRIFNLFVKGFWDFVSTEFNIRSLFLKSRIRSLETFE